MTREANTEEWVERVRAQRASGKSMSAFCREHGIKAKTFWWWARKLGEAGVAKRKALPAKSSRFARIELVGPSQTLVVSVRLPGGVVVESESGYPDPLWIRAVVSGLVEEGFR